MKPHLIMPMGGAGSRFYNRGYLIPKPLIEINNKPFLYWSTMSIMKYVDIMDLTFVVLKQHIDEFKIDNVVYSFFPEAKIIVLPDILPGPVFTAIKGVESINDSAPVIINDCDHMFKCNELNRTFHGDGLIVDGALLSFKSNEPQFSYIKYNENGKITGTIEKKVVSDHAICGAYIFRNARLFLDLAKLYIDKCPYKECYMSGIYNIMCQKELIIKDYLLDYHVEFGTPEEYEKAKDSQYFCDLV